MTTDVVNKKKQSKTLTTVGAAVLLIIIIADLLVWKGDRAMKSQTAVVNGKISQAELSISRLPAADSALETRLAAAKNALAQAQNALPSAVDRNDIIDFIVAQAASSKVTAFPMNVNSVPPAKTKTPYYQLQIAVSVTGTLENTEAFLSGLKSGVFPTLVVTDCAIVKQSPVDLAKSEAGAEVKTDLVLAVYTTVPPEDNAS
jgi:hypothetical protein